MVEQIELMDLSGRQITNYSIENNSQNSLTLSLDNGIPSGVYFLRLSTKNGVFVKQVIIDKGSLGINQ